MVWRFEPSNAVVGPPGHGHARRARVVLDVGATGSTIMILRGGRLASRRSVELGGRDLTRAVARHLEVDHDTAHRLRQQRIAAAGEAAGPDWVAEPTIDRAAYEAVRPLLHDLVREVTLAVRGYGTDFRGPLPQVIVLSGGDALEPGLAPMLEQAGLHTVVGGLPVGQPGDRVT